jgi:pSer/pThr/pTyr-binding forkhead associated (FHA) protein
VSNDETLDSAEANAQPAIVLKLRVSLKGRPIRSFSFVKDVVTIGRDPEADVFLDNPGVSRHHLQLEKCAGGYCAEDSGSANGTLLNDKPLQRSTLEEDDVLRVGKFTLWASYEKDRREARHEAALPATTNVGTTVLTTAELERMLTKVRDFDAEPRPAPPGPPPAPATAARSGWRSVAAAAVLGALLGSALTWWVIH